MLARTTAVAVGLALLFLVVVGASGLASIQDSTGVLDQRLGVPGGAGPPLRDPGAVMTSLVSVPQSSNSVVAVIPIPGTGPSSNGAVFDPADGNIYLASNFTNLTAISGSTNTVATEIDLGPYAAPELPTYVAPVNELYAPQISSGLGPDNVSVISGSTDAVVTNVSTGYFSSPRTATYDPTNHDLYVPDYGQTNVTVIDTTTDQVVATIPVGAGPDTPAYDPANGDLYVACTLSDNVSIISGATNTVLATISHLGLNVPQPDEELVTEAPVYDPVSQEVYQPDPANYTLSVLRGTTFVQNISVGRGSATPLVDPENGNLYVPIGLTNTTIPSPNDLLRVVNPSTNMVLATITVGYGPDTPVFDPANGEVYVSNQNDGTVSAINASTNTVVATIAVGGQPVVGAFDPVNRELYVPTYNGANVTVIATGPSSHVSGSGTYPVTFAETGLPTGASWNVTLDAGRVNETSPTVVFEGIPNGTHVFIIGPWADPKSCDYQSPSDSGTLVVAGGPKTVNVPFSCQGTSPAPGGPHAKSMFLGLPGFDGYYLVGGIAVASLVGYIAMRRLRQPPVPGTVPTLPSPPPPTGAWTPPPPVPPR